jgi:predicted amidohydrolase
MHYYNPADHGGVSRVSGEPASGPDGSAHHGLMEMEAAMRVGTVQFAPRFGRMEENLERVFVLLEAVGVDLAVLPELPFTGYRFRDRQELAGLSDDPGRSVLVERLVSFCASREMHLVTGYAEKRSGDRIFNSALLIGPGGIEGRYRKLHLFHREKELFDPGDLPLDVFEVKGTRLGMMVCFDWIFPEAARTLALRGADVICHPANLVLPWCQKTMISRCIENRVFAVTANRTGTEDRGEGPLTFTGCSQIVGPQGEVLADSDSLAEEVRIAEIDPLTARDKWMTPGNHLFDDRRPEFYGAGRTNVQL